MRQRAPNPLNALFPRIRQDMLAILLLQPQRSWYRSDLASELGVRPSSLQRDLERLTVAGILRRHKDGGRTYFQANPECPFLPNLCGLLEKTVGVVGTLRQLFAPSQDRIRVAFVFGSVAQGTQRPASDVDLLVIGTLSLKDLLPTLRAAETRLGREVNAHAYTAAEFGAKTRSDHFVRSVLDKERLLVLGTEDDLEDLARRRPH